MSWVRSRRRVGAWLALLALTCQLVLSFGHFHHDIAAPVAAGQVTASLPGDVPGDVPPQPEDRADGYCAICALIHLAGSVLPSAPPPIPLPFEFSTLPRQAVATAGLTAFHHFSFRSRAPPIA